MNDPFGSFSDYDPTRSRQLAAMNQDPSTMSMVPQPTPMQFGGSNTPDSTPLPDESTSNAPPPPPMPKPSSSGSVKPKADEAMAGFPNPTDEQMAGAKENEDKARAGVLGMEKPMQDNLAAAQAANTDYANTLKDRAATIDQTMANMPKDTMAFVMKQSPLFLGLAALAGGAFHSSAVTGLASLNGAVKGIVEGDRQAYDDAITQYRNSLQEMQAKFDLQDKTYAAAQKNFGLSAEANQLALQFTTAKLGWATDDMKTFQAQKDNIAKLLWEAKQKDRDYAEQEKIAGIRVGGMMGPNGGLLDPQTVDDASTAVIFDNKRMSQYAQGTRAQPVRNQINARISERLRENGLTMGEVLSRQNMMHSQAKSLNDLVGMKNAVSAYEVMAKGNGDRVLQLVNSVNTSGVPLINSGERLGKLALGDPDAAELMQVLQNWKTETARIVGNPTLKGQLTDTAREEIAQVVPANMTPAQAARIVGRLSYEFELRKAGIDQAIADAQNQMQMPQISGAGSQTPTPPLPPPPSAPGGNASAGSGAVIQFSDYHP